MRWLELIKEVGAYFGIMCFFVWRDFRREERLEKQVEKLNEFIQKTLVDLIAKTQEVMNRCGR
jgi:hypothetical protein